MLGVKINSETHPQNAINFVAAFRNRLPAKIASLPGHQLDLSPVLNTSTKEVLILNPNLFSQKVLF